MGNQPSSPQTPTATSVSVPPPLPPQCDLDCQKQKKLTLLKQALDAADPIKDPDGYEKARIAYFTLLNGPGWLANEKHKIASEEVEPVLKSYKQQYDALQGEIQSQGVFKNLADMLKSQESSDEQSNAFLKESLESEKDKARVADRLNELGGPSQTSSYMSWIVDFVIAILGFFVVYKLYMRFSSPTIMSQSLPVLSST